MKTTIEMAREAGLLTWLKPPEDVIERLKALEVLVRADERAALVQEPVGEVVVESMCVRGSDAMRVRMHFYKEIPPVGSKIYTTPPAAQRPWVGLTDEERGKVYADWRWSDGRTSNLALCEAIEAKLKEKMSHL
jgi:hypothetical protein